MQDNFKIILSRTDSIGDVVLTLPMAGWIKKKYPACKIYFLGSAYTKEIIALSEHVDEFIDYTELKKKSPSDQIGFLKSLKADVIVHVFPVKEIAQLAKQAAIPLRVGTTNRIYHWFTCNKRVPLSRKNSDLHEAQLNIQLLGFLNTNTNIASKDISELYGFTKIPNASEDMLRLIDKTKFNLILHPKSRGNGMEWGLKNFETLIKLLPKEKFKIFLSGTEEEGKLLQDLIQGNPSVTDLTGKFSLREFIAFISHCDGLVASGTGPLHLASALGKRTVGLFPSRRPIHPGRWKPIGINASYLVFDPNCERCRKGENCDCISRIDPKQVLALLEKK